MEIIKRRDWQPPTFSAQIECSNCSSVLKIDADDVHWHSWAYGDGYGVECPVCGKYRPIVGKAEKLYYKYLNSR